MANEEKRYSVITNQYLYRVVADSEADLPKDSTTGPNYETKLWKTGSSCVCLKEKTLFILNSRKEWVKITVDLDDDDETPSENNN